MPSISHVKVPIDYPHASQSFDDVVKQREKLWPSSDGIALDLDRRKQKIQNALNSYNINL